MNVGNRSKRYRRNARNRGQRRRPRWCCVTLSVDKRSVIGSPPSLPKISEVNLSYTTHTARLRVSRTRGLGPLFNVVARRRSISILPRLTASTANNMRSLIVIVALVCLCEYGSCRVLTSYINLLFSLQVANSYLLYKIIKKIK